MTSANLDLVRSICEPRGRGDFSSDEWIEGTQVGEFRGLEPAASTGVALDACV
jgi:hypothetical protein